MNQKIKPAIGVIVLVELIFPAIFGGFFYGSQDIKSDIFREVSPKKSLGINS